MIHEFDCVPWLLDDPLAAVTVFPAAVRRGRAEGPPGGRLRDGRRCRGHDRGLRERAVRLRHPHRGGRHREHGLAHAAVRRLGAAQPLRDRRASTAGSSPRTGRCATRTPTGSRSRAWVDGIRAGVPTGPSAWDGHLANLAAFAADRVAARRRPGRGAARGPAGPVLLTAPERNWSVPDVHRLVHRAGVRCAVPSGARAHPLHRFEKCLGESPEPVVAARRALLRHAVPRGTMSESRHIFVPSTTAHTPDRESTT